MPKVTRSVFLYGNPTVVKKQLIQETQRAYTDLINQFIETLVSDERYYPAILTNNKQSPVIRLLEKGLRETHELGSAYGQNAIDKAVVELHNHFTRIKNKLYGVIANKLDYMLPYIQTLTLFSALLTNQCELTALQKVIQIEQDKDKPNEEKLVFYASIQEYLDGLTTAQRDDYKETVRVMFYEKLNHWKLPFVKSAPLQLDSRVSTFSPAENIKADYVLSVKLLGSRQRVELPVSTSGNSLRRLKQYPTGSLTLALLKNGNVRVGVPFEKKIKPRQPKTVLGVDVGITDLLRVSNNTAYGTFTGMDKLYGQVVEQKLKQRNKLLSVKRKYQKELRKCQDNNRKAVLRKKIYNISKTLAGRKTLNQRIGTYQHKVTLRLSKSIKSFVRDIKGKNVLVAIEDLNITEFDRGKNANRRDSFWVRGRLLTKLQETLSWNGIPFVEVEPAYTSKTCPVCSNVDDKNRTGKTFVCTVCKHSGDADHIAGINIANRAYDTEIQDIVKQYPYNTKNRHRAIKDLLVTRHRSYPIAI